MPPLIHEACGWEVGQAVAGTDAETHETPQMRGKNCEWSIVVFSAKYFTSN